MLQWFHVITTIAGRYGVVRKVSNIGQTAAHNIAGAHDRIKIQLQTIRENKLLRILFVNYEYPPLGGGGGIVNAWLAEELAKSHNITVLTSQGLGLPLHEQENGVRIIRAPVLFRRRQAAANFASLLAFLPSGIRSGRRLLQNKPFDIINTHFVLPSGPVGDALAKYASIPNVLSVHGGDLYDPSKWSSPHRHRVLRIWIRRLLEKANLVIGQSHNTLDNMRRFYTSAVKSELIPLGIRRPPKAAGSREEYGLPVESTLLVTIGRLVARKAVNQLVTAMRTLKTSNADLVIIGSGPEEEILRKQAYSLGIQRHVHFMGQVSDLDKVKLLRLSDIYVSTSQHEGFGLVFLEAMAEGIPVVCYDFGGQSDFLEDHVNGRLFPLNDLDSLVQGTIELIRHKDSRIEMGQENLRRVEKFFIDTCAARYEKVFEETIADKNLAAGLGE